jgi:hypothetical protein
MPVKNADEGDRANEASIVGRSHFALQLIAVGSKFEA